MRWLWGILLLFVCVNVDNPSRSFAVSDVECIAYTIYHETNTEPLAARRATYDVILERMRRTGKSACEVVLEPKQFSHLTFRKIQQVDKNMLQDYWRYANMPSSCSGCTNFTRVEVYKDWMKKFKYRGQIGSHKYFEEDL